MKTSHQPPASQTALVAALMKHLTAGAQPVERFETHISWVLVAGDHAYKIKKAVALDFLDCSTLAARRRFCEEELRLNRRLAPGLYIDVVKVTGDAADPHLDGAGEAIEYAVHMHAFHQDALWNRRVAGGQLSAQEVDAFADLLGRFHQHAAIAPPASAWGSMAAFAANVSLTFNALARLALSPESQSTIARLRLWVSGQSKKLARVMGMRQRAGRVRECHGDLHLGNIVTTERGIEAFDCIEFSDALRWIDVIDDLAFCWMDLARHGRSDLATRFLNSYLSLTGDYGGLPLLRFYSVHRALVRCLVLLLRAAQATLPCAADAASHEALAYLAFAGRLAAPGRPAILITHGYSGSGKTHFSRQAADLLGAVHLRSDVERKRLHGLRPGDRSGAGADATLYGPAASRRTYNRLLALARIVVQSGMTALVDAAFLSYAQRQRFARHAERLGVPFRIFEVRASHSVMTQRIALRTKAGADASDADLAVLAQQLQAAQPLSEREREQAIVVDTDAGMPPSEVARLCRPLEAMLDPACGAAPASLPAAPRQG